MSKCTVRSQIQGHIQGEDYATESSAEHDLDRAPRFASEHIQVTCKCDTRQEVSEEDVDGTGRDELVENRPVRYISPAQIDEVLLHKAKGT
jgi:hypothetical protein